MMNTGGVKSVQQGRKLTAYHVIHPFDRYFVGRAIEIKQPKVGGEKCIHYFAEKGDLGTVKSLLESGVSVNSKHAGNGETALHFAVRSKDLNVVRFLVDNGADAVESDKYGRSALYFSIFLKQLRMVKLLSERTTAVHVKKDIPMQLSSNVVGGSEGTPTPYHSGDEPSIFKDLELNPEEVTESRISDSHHENVKCSSENQHSANLENAQYISVENVASLERKTDFESPLHAAVRSGSVEIVKALLKEGADVHQRNDYGQNVLHVAATSGNLETVALLLTKGVNVNEKDNKGRPVLHYGRLLGRTAVLKLLITGNAADADVDINVKDEYGQTLLHCFAVRGNIEMVKFLVIKGAKVREKDNYGRTALFYAESSRSTETERFLRFREQIA